MRLLHPPIRDREIGVQMTPMIDVVFLLLIFFICTASFQAPEQLLSADLSPLAGTTLPPELEMPPDLERVLVTGTRRDDNTHWKVNERECPTLADVQAVLAAVAQIDSDLPVILDVDDAVPLGDMIVVYDLCRLAGFAKIQFAAGT